ncbi:MAG: UvrB/UvrC motif-containing protein [Bacillota bacterium]|jgi:protein arginine kinase activator
MLCQNCGEREARISITQIINNKKTEIHLCHQCAQQRGHADSVFALPAMLASLVDWTDTFSPGKSCPKCGLSESQLRQQGKFGCEQCYQTWAPWVKKIVSRVQGRTSHGGKIPRSADQQVKIRRELDQLQQRLQSAIHQERFEDAAKIRDRIRELKKEVEGGTP